MEKILLSLFISLASIAYAGDFKWKSIENCLTASGGLDRDHHYIRYNACEDGTISYTQPYENEPDRWEGLCGQTAVSNITSMLCHQGISPLNVDKYGADIIPGQHPITMRSSLNNIFSESSASNTCPKSVTWKLKKSWSAESYLKTIKKDLFKSTHQIIRERPYSHVKVTPIPVLINYRGLQYHWVTLVDIISNKNDPYGCDVVVNTWGRQASLTCEDFLDYADHSGIGQRLSLGTN